MFKIEIKNKWIVTKGEWGGSRGKKGKSHQGTCIKHPWTRTMGRIECGRWGWVGSGRLMGKMGTTVIKQ